MSQVAAGWTELARRPVVTRKVNAPPADVWSVLSDGWQYATWVVGASHPRGRS
jgi:hypothetical protein